MKLESIITCKVTTKKGKKVASFFFLRDLKINQILDIRVSLKGQYGIGENLSNMGHIQYIRDIWQPSSKE